MTQTDDGTYTCRPLTMMVKEVQTQGPTVIKLIRINPRLTHPE